MRDREPRPEAVKGRAEDGGRGWDGGCGVDVRAAAVVASRDGSGTESLYFLHSAAAIAVGESDRVRRDRLCRRRSARLLFRRSRFEGGSIPTNRKRSR